MPARNPLIHARVIRLRRVVHWSIAIAIVAFAAASVASHLRRNDWRDDGRWHVVTGLAEGPLIEIAVQTDANPAPDPVRIRLLGLSQRSADWSLISRDHLSARLVGQRVLVRLEPMQARDNAGQLQGYLYMNGRNVNLDLVREGIARAERGRDHTFASAMAQAEASARQKRLGVWARADQTRN